MLKWDPASAFFFSFLIFIDKYQIYLQEEKVVLGQKANILE